MNRKDKIQYLFITHLLKEGRIKLMLPDGITLEVGITKEGRDGFLEKCPDYCWVNTSQHERSAFIDSYNLSLGYPADEDKFVYVDQNDSERSVIEVV